MSWRRNWRNLHINNHSNHRRNLCHQRDPPRGDWSCPPTQSKRHQQEGSQKTHKILTKLLGLSSPIRGSLIRERAVPWRVFSRKSARFLLRMVQVMALCRARSKNFRHTWSGVGHTRERSQASEEGNGRRAGESGLFSGARIPPRF